MDSSTPTPPVSRPDPGLPPVQPPSGQMIFRLFLVPFLIVAVLVGLYLLGQSLYGRSRSAGYYLRNLDNANPEIRWRAASDLSQELPRSPKLAGDALFALDLAERLQTAIEESNEPEKNFASKVVGLSANERETQITKELDPRRKLIMFLGACLGSFQVPVGVPALRELALQTSGMEPEALGERRRRALFALSALGENLKRYDKLADEEKDRIDSELSEAIKKESQSKLARLSRDYLAQRRKNKADSFGVAGLIQKCGDDPDPSIRMYAAYTANFWHGAALEDKQIEDTLVKLSTDSGAGEEERLERLKNNPAAGPTREITRKKGYEVQANANMALARRGSPKVRRDLLEEMISPEKLREIFVLQDANGKEEPNEALVVVTVVGSLKALADLHRLRPEMPMDRYVTQVEQLTQNSNATLSTEAQELLPALKK